MTDEKQAWFLRVPVDIIRDPYIMKNASATDWRVYLAIAKHQGYQNRKTFPLSIAKTAEEAHCSRRAAFRSITWWTQIGALCKSKRRRMNVYEIPRFFTVPPGMCASPRHITPRVLKRDKQGRIVPTHGTGKVPAHGTSEVPAHGTPNQKSSSEFFIETPPPPPHGGRTLNTTPRGVDVELVSASPPMISQEVLEELKKTLGLEKLRAYMQNHGYPLTLLSEGKISGTNVPKLKDSDKGTE
jgi:hypothetical protein